MEKRLLLAIGLSLLILITWTNLTSKVYHVENTGVATETPAVQKPSLETVPVAKSVTPEKESVPLKEFVYPQPHSNLIFIEPQGAIKEIEFKDYQSDKFILKEAFLLLGQEMDFVREASGENEILFIYTDKDKRISKRFDFSNPNYGIGLDITIQNLSDMPLKTDLSLVLGALNFSLNPGEAGYQDMMASTTEKVVHADGRKARSFGKVRFAGLRDRYFCAIIEPENKDSYSAFVKKVQPQESNLILTSPEFSIAPGGSVAEKFRIYLGPQDLGIISQNNPAWTSIVYYGMFDIIAQVFAQALSWLNKVVHNWGFAIIILTLLIQLLLYPLTLKQMRSMKEMQVLQPKVEVIRKTYKDNPQRMNKEIMELYKEHKVNPFGGCLPLLLQMPIFIALYQVQSRLIFFKGARFLWVADLAKPDNAFSLMGKQVNVLPILTTILILFQQKFTTPQMGGEAAQQQKIMMFIFPIMLLVFFYNATAGFNLYMFVNTGAMLLQAMITRRR